MTENSKITAALVQAQMNMTKATKTANNPHFRSKYADLGSVMDACMGPLNSAGIAVLQPVGEDELGRFVETVFLHSESDETLKCRVPLILQKNDMQGFGSAVTYARRYGLMAMAGIAPEDDDGNAAAKAAPRGGQRRDEVRHAITALHNAKDLDALQAIWADLPNDAKTSAEVMRVKDEAKKALTPRPSDSIDNDEIPY